MNNENERVTGSPLPKEQVIKAIEKKNPKRIPMVFAKWWGEGLVDQYGDALAEFEKYPNDVEMLMIRNPVDPERMSLSWNWKTSKARDSACIIDNWDKLDEFIEKIPQPDNDDQFEASLHIAQKAHADGRYLLFGWWHLFFEQPWMLRGMENLMCDYYAYPDMIHRFHQAMCDTYEKYLLKAVEMFQPDGFWTSDDLGHQTGPMMSPDIFHEFLFPYYNKIGTFLKKNNIHFWLHSCGDNTLLMPDLIHAGVSIFHPVQKGTMDAKETVEKFGDQISFLAGFDVQHALQELDPDAVREEVKRLIDLFDKQEGGMCIAAGNGIVAGTPIDNIRAFLDEAFKYGATHRNQLSAQNPA